MFVCDIYAHARRKEGGIQSGETRLGEKRARKKKNPEKRSGARREEGGIIPPRARLWVRDLAGRSGDLPAGCSGRGCRGRSESAVDLCL